MQLGRVEAEPLRLVTQGPAVLTSRAVFDRPVPIAIVLPAFAPGGTERQMIELVRRLDRDRWEVHLCCMHAHGPWFERAAQAATSVAEFPIRSFWHPHVVGEMRAFAAWCRRLRIAVVQTCELYSNIFALPAAALAQVPARIGSRREIVAGKSLGQIALQRAAYACAHKVVANAEAAAARLRAERVPPDRIVVIPNGLDLTLFRPPEPRPSYRRVVMVANLRPEKGHDTLIDAAKRILNLFPDAHFDIVGDGTERARLVEYAENRGVSQAFSFWGHSEEVPSRLCAADVFVLPSRSEAFPNAVLEAMAAGLPVVASAVGGILEVVQDGQTGLLVPPGRPDALAEAVCRLMADRDLSFRLAGAGRALVEARYSFERMVSALENVYVSELSRTGARLAPGSRRAEV